MVYAVACIYDLLGDVRLRMEYRMVSVGLCREINGGCNATETVNDASLARELINIPLCFYSIGQDHSVRPAAHLSELGYMFRSSLKQGCCVSWPEEKKEPGKVVHDGGNEKKRRTRKAIIQVSCNVTFFLCGISTLFFFFSSLLFFFTFFSAAANYATYTHTSHYAFGVFFFFSFFPLT